MFFLMNPPSLCKLVVAGLIQDDHGNILISQRTATQSHPHYWEFPGGKIEPRESPEQALRRELKEELGIQATIVGIYHVLFYSYPDYDILLLAYTCKTDEVPRPIEVAQVRWVSIAALHQYSLLPADLPIVEQLQREKQGH